MNVFELKQVAIRLIEEKPLYSTKPIDSPEIAIEVVGHDMEVLDREEIRVIYLDSALRPLAVHTASIGSLDRSIGHPRELLKAAFLLNAQGIILMHNHPSGNTSPSQDDNLLTDRMNKLCSMAGIKLYEHLIVGAYEGGYYSYAEHKKIKNLNTADLGLSVIEPELEGLAMVAEN